jgi:hypothetical protein
MRFTVTFKDPDGPYECIQDAAKESLAAIEGLSVDEREELLDKRVESIKATTSKFFEYGEYVRVEIDTDAGTATVLPVK